MSSFVTVFGGSGFIGRYVVRALCKQGYRVRVAVRRPHLAGDMRVCGEPGQVQLIQANARNRPSVYRAIEGADAVINLVGIIQEKGRQKFQTSHVTGAENIAEITNDLGVSRFIHLSAIGADSESECAYFKTKGEGEEAIIENFEDAIIIRPSLVFGSDDELTNKLGSMAAALPFIPLFGGGTSKLQPIYVDDLAEGIVAALLNGEAGEVYEATGPSVYTWRELNTAILEEIDQKKVFLPIPYWLGEIMGMLTSIGFKLWPFHKAPITGTQVKMMRIDNIGSEAKSVADLGAPALQTLETVMPTYMFPLKDHGQFHKEKVEA